jgi:hypothetical protein
VEKAGGKRGDTSGVEGKRGKLKGLETCAEKFGKKQKINPRMEEGKP